MDKNLLKSSAQRLNVYDASVIRKAEEYLRLYQTKASLKTLNDQAKIVLCLDLASQALGKGFDKEAALPLCGFKKSAYQNNLNIIEKVLDLDKNLTISDLCVQLGCTVIKDDAEAILNKYRQVGGEDGNLEHPQYIAVAIYLACKAKKISVDKSKIIPVSRLKPAQWRELVSTFENLKLGEKHNKRKLNENCNEDKMEEEEESSVNLVKNDIEEVEEYEVWKKRILEEAYEALKREKGGSLD